MFLNIIDISTDVLTMILFFILFTFKSFLNAYQKNKVISAIILIVLFFSSQVDILNILTMIPFIVAIITTFCLLAYETISEYNGTYDNYFKVTTLFLIFGLVLIFIIISKLLSFKFTEFFEVINILKYYGLLLSILLCFIENNKKSDDYHSLESNETILEISSNQISNNNRKPNKNLKFNKIYLAIILGLSLIAVIGYNMFNTTVIDLEKVVHLKYNTNEYVTKVDYYTPWDYYNEDNFYIQLYDEANRLGYTDEQVKSIIPTYSSEVQSKLKGAKLKVKLDHNKDITYNESIEFNITYDENFAKENNLKFKNTHFTKQAIYLKSPLSESDFKIDSLNLDEIKEKLEKKLEDEKVIFTNINKVEENLVIREKKKHDISFLELKYQLDGNQNKIFYNKKIDNLIYEIEIYQQNNEFKLNFDNYNISYNVD